MKNKLFYDSNERQFKGKNPNNKKGWISFGEMDEIASQKFVTYVRDKVSIGVRDESYPDSDAVLKYYEEWRKDYFGQ